MDLHTLVLDTVFVEFAADTCAVSLESTRFAHRVGALENPVLPRAQPAEYARLHGFGTGESKVGFHSGQGVGREAGALFQENPDVVLPVNVIESEGDETKRAGTSLLNQCLAPNLFA